MVMHSEFSSWEGDGKDVKSLRAVFNTFDGEEFMDSNSYEIDALKTMLKDRKKQGQDTSFFLRQQIEYAIKSYPDAAQAYTAPEAAL